MSGRGFCPNTDQEQQDRGFRNYIYHARTSFYIFTIYVVYILLYIRFICVYTLANAPLGMRAGGAAYFPRAGQGKGYNTYNLINNMLCRLFAVDTAFAVVKVARMQLCIVFYASRYACSTNT